MITQPQIGFSEMFKDHLELVRSFLPRKRMQPVVGMGATFEPEIEQPVRVAAAPLPPCRPLNRAEAQEAATLAQLRGALYPTESR